MKPSPAAQEGSITTWTSRRLWRDGQVKTVQCDCCGEPVESDKEPVLCPECAEGMLRLLGQAVGDEELQDEIDRTLAREDDK